MNVFYTKRIEGKLAFLAETEAQHLGKVMRKKIGDLIHLIDGQGGHYTGEIISLDKRSASVRITDSHQEPEPTARLHLAVAPTKNNSRLEWLLEKATEVGVSDFWPFVSFHSERKNIKMDRLEKIVLAATKQSLKACLPKIHPLQNFPDLLNHLAENFPEKVDKYIAYIDPEVNSHLQDNYSAGQDVVILIGPEGGFSPEEVELARQKGFQPVSLGSSRLRTETAGLVATTIVQLKNQTR